MIADYREKTRPTKGKTIVPRLNFEIEAEDRGSAAVDKLGRNVEALGPRHRRAGGRAGQAGAGGGKRRAR